jgi:hypothetical protein
VKEPTNTAVEPTRIDYLGLVAGRYQQERNDLTGKVDYSKLIETNDPDQIPGQLRIPESEAL